MKHIKKKLARIISLIKQNKLLSLILILSLLLRFIGIYPGYHTYHSDEGMSYSSAIEMIRNLNLDPTRYDYPSLIPEIHAVLYVFLFIPVFVLFNSIFSAGVLPAHSDNIIDLWQKIVVINQQTMVIFWGRYITAFFGVLVVLMSYLVANFYFKDKRIGLVAAFLTAVNFRQVLNSHLGLPDIYNAFFLLFSLFTIGKLLERDTLKNYLMSGTGLALFFSTKFQIFTLPAFLLVHLILTWKRTKSKSVFSLLKSFFRKEVLLSALLALFIVLIINHYHLVRFEKFRAINSYNLLKYGFGTKALNFFPLSYLYHVGIGQLISATIVLGLIIGLRQRFIKSFILISPLIPFFFLFIYYTRGGYYVRNFVTVAPVLLIFAGVFSVWFWEAFKKRLNLSLNTNLAILLTTIAISITQFQNSLISSVAYLRPWEYVSARNFASANIPEKSTIVSHPWDMYPRDKNYSVVPLEPSTIYSLQEMQEEGAQYGFLNLDWLTLSSYWWMNRTTADSIKFWEKPNDLLSNTYGSVNSRELASFAIAAFVKPWQAPDMNILIVKIPKPLDFENKKEVKRFRFDNKNDLNGWFLIDGNEAIAKKIYFDPDVGKEEKGSLKIENGPRQYPLILATSPVIPLEDGKAVLVDGWLKTSEVLLKKARDGYLRVDFYNGDPGKIGLLTKYSYASLSSRMFGSDDWVEKKISVIPPKNTKFMTVSVGTNGGTGLWADDISVYFSENQITDPKTKPPYIDYHFDIDILFPYSQGGL